MGFTKRLHVIAEQIKHKEKAPRRYVEEFMLLKCKMDLLASGVFPNFKEITESMGAYNALAKLVHKEKLPGKIRCIIVGDGVTPRTGVLFALRTPYDIVSIDPIMRGNEWFTLEGEPIKRLMCISKKIEDSWFRDEVDDITTVYVLVHAHVQLDFIRHPKAYLIAIPCCVDQNVWHGQEPDIVYDDHSIWSPKNTVKVWKGKLDD